MIQIQRTNKWLLVGMAGTAAIVIAVLLALMNGGQAASSLYSTASSPLSREEGNFAAPASGGVMADGVASVEGDFSLAPPSDEAGAPSQERVILRNATLRLTVENAEISLASIASMAAEMGGWVVNSSTSAVSLADGGEVTRGSITIRVPSERLDEALGIIKSGGGQVESESISGQDVTQAYVDLTSRLLNLEAAETQLREIMASASQTTDVLAVYSELVRLRGEIESARGQIQYYEQAAAFSSISIELVPQAMEARVQIAGWSPGRTVEKALAALISVLQFAADALIVMAVVVLPVVLVMGGMVWFVRRILKRRTQAA